MTDPWADVRERIQKSETLGMYERRAVRNLLSDADALLAVIAIERLAAIEHSQWMAWARTLMEEEVGLSQERRERWQELMVDYAELSDEVKEYDREWARTVRAALPEHLR